MGKMVITTAKKRRIILIQAVLFLILHSNLFAQETETIFPDLHGQELLDSLITVYRTNTVLTYDNARDTLFAKIDNNNDSLTCVYTGYTVYVDPTQDPPTYTYRNYNFQTEHTWPQSKGATGQAKSDMHHLYPVWGNANGSRGNNPFAEIPDNETNTWWYLNGSYSDPLQGATDLCSEKASGRLEPREDHKGNVARAMFYFYTMYKDLADSLFFAAQKNVLYQWHYIDPVDSSEYARNGLIASYQADKRNPFIVDTTLIRRAYFNREETK